MSQSEAQRLGTPVAALSLLVDRNWEPPPSKEEVLRLVRVMRVVANEEQAITIRLASILASGRSFDVQAAGYPGWDAFLTGEAPWKLSLARAYVRLVTSGLDVVQEAVSKNEIELTDATQAPSEIGNAASRAAQAEWLRETKMGRWLQQHRACLDVLSGDEMRRVLDGRRLAELLLGSGAPKSALDRFMLECHAQMLTNEQIQELAGAAPSVPDRLGRAVPAWSNDPATGLLGPWVAPTDIKQVVTQLRATEPLFACRRVLLGMGYELIRDHSLWKAVPGCNGLEQLCREHFGISQRTLQEYAREGRNYLRHPEVRREVVEGRLTIDRANLALERAGDSKLSVQSWLELVRRLSRAELHRVREQGGDPRKVYDPALAMAQAVESILRGETKAQEIGGSAARIAEHLLAVGATGEVQVAMRDAGNRRSQRAEPAYIFVPPKLLAAADYLLATVVLRPTYGTRRMVELDSYTCQNPRCRRRTVRAHPHHLHERQHGGTDDPWNIVTLCVPCHLRGVHSGNLSVVRIDDSLVWTWPDEDVAGIMHSPVRDLDYDRPRRVDRSSQNQAHSPS